MNSIEKILYNGEIVALILRNNYENSGVQFFTPQDFSLQMGSMSHPKGYEISPHTHNQIRREIVITQEVLLIKKGKVKVDFYSLLHEYLESRILYQGDIIFLASQGHGFTILEETTMVEIKTGPYLGNDDKIRFHAKDSGGMYDSN